MTENDNPTSGSSQSDKEELLENVREHVEERKSAYVKMGAVDSPDSDSSQEEIIERAVEWAFYSDIITYSELVQVVDKDEAEAIRYLAETVEGGNSS